MKSSLDSMFDEAEGVKPTSGNPDLDAMFDDAEAPSFMAGPGTSIPGIPKADEMPTVRQGEPTFPLPPSMQPNRPGATGHWGGASGSWDLPDQVQNPVLRPIQNPKTEPAPPPSGFGQNLARAAFPSTTSAPSIETPEMIPDGMGGYKPTTIMAKEPNPLDALGDIGGAGARAVGTTADAQLPFVGSLLPWDARKRRPDGSQENWLEGMQDPETGLARPVREKLVKVIGNAWDKATDEEKPYIERVGNALLAELGGAAFMGAATVEDPIAMAPVAEAAAATRAGQAATSPFRAASDAAGRGLQKLGVDQMYKKINPGVNVEKKGFDVQKVFDQGLDQPKNQGILPGGTIDDIIRNSDKEIKAASDEMKRRIQAGVDEGHRVNIPEEIDRAIAPILADKNGSKENQKLAGFIKKWGDHYKQEARDLTPDGSGNLDLMATQYFKQNRGDEGKWHDAARKMGFPIPKTESEQSQVAEILYHHLNDAIDDAAPDGIRDLNKTISELIPIRQSAAHRKIVDDRKARIGLKSMVAFATALQNPFAGAALLGAEKASTSGRVASGLYRLGEKLRTASTPAEKARYVAALKKLGVSDEEIAAGTHMMEETGGETDPYKSQDLRVKTDPNAPPTTTDQSPPPPPNALPFRRQGEPAPQPPRRRTLPQEDKPPEEGEGPILYQDKDKPFPDMTGGKPRIKPEEVPALVENAKKHFGTTQNLKEAGYLTPDGDFLDFSGKNDGGSPNTRAYDHNEINNANGEKQDFQKYDYQRAGFIRLYPENGGMEVMAPPTPIQEQRIRRWVAENEKKGRETQVDAFRSYSRRYPKGTKADKILKDLDEAFTGKKVKPQTEGQRLRADDTMTGGRDDEGQILYQEDSQKNLPAKTEDDTKEGPVFYSQLRRTAPEILKKAGGKMKPQDFLNSLLKGGKIKADEVKWSGLLEYLKARGKGMKPGGDVATLLTPEDVKVLNTKIDEANNEMNAVVREHASQNPRANSVTGAHRERYDALMEERAALVKQLREGKKASVDASDNTPVTAKEIEDFLDENEVEVSEVKHGVAGDRRPKYKNYSIENDLHTGEEPKDYGELLLSWKRKPKTQRMLGIPEGEKYNHSHWDTPDVGVHVRYSTKNSSNGEKVLFIEEMQGDWGQEGRKRGFKGTKEEELGKLQEQEDKLRALPDSPENGDKLLDLKKQIERLKHRVSGASYDVPAGPFVDVTQKWTLLGMKRMIRYAAENGFDRIAWTTGEQQAKRWNFSQVVTEIKYTKMDNGKYSITPMRAGTEVRANGLDLDRDLSRAELVDVIGEEMAARIDKKVENGQKIGSLDAKDFSLGGEGHKAYYNKMLPSAVEKYTEKNWGVKVDDTELKLPKAKRKPVSNSNKTPDGLYEVQEIPRDAEEMGLDPEYYLHDNNGRRLDGPFTSEDEALDSDAWPEIPNEEEYKVEERDPEDLKYDIEQHHDGRWYIVDNEKPRERVTPKEQKSLFPRKPDTREEGGRYEGDAHTGGDEADSPVKHIADGFDTEEEAQHALESLREDDGVDGKKYWVVEDYQNKDYDGPFDTHDEAMEAMPTTRDYDAASIEKEYPELDPEYQVVDEDGNSVDGEYYEDEAHARRVMMEHWRENEGGDYVAPKDPQAEHIELKQPSIKITAAMKKSALEGQELFQKAKSTVKGHIQKKRLNSVITLFKGRADVTTWMHEHGHWLRSEVLTPEQSQQVLDWAGEKTWTREAEEKFARGFERYLYNGVAPAKSMAAPFETMKDAFRRVYKDARGTEIEKDVPEGIKLVYDAIFLRGQKIRNMAQVQRLMKALGRAGKQSPRLIALLKAEINAPKQKEAADAR